MNKEVKLKSRLLIVAVLLGFTVANPGFARDPRTFPGEGSRAVWNQASRIYNEGIALGKAGKLDAAIANYKRAIEIYPHADVFYLNLGVDYEARKRPGDLSKAEAAYRKAAELDPNDWRNWNAMAGILATNNKYKDCREAGLKALQCKPPAKDAAEIRECLKAVEQYLTKQK